MKLALVISMATKFIINMLRGYNILKVRCNDASAIKRFMQIYANYVTVRVLLLYKLINRSGKNVNTKPVPSLLIGHEQTYC